MKQLSKIKRLNPRDVWANEATEFTPWLAENLQELGEALGMELELIEREAGVGDFSLDILARDFGSGHIVVIENQLTKTDHDHLGKLLTYASGYNSYGLIWIAESFRDEHRKALEWINERTDADTGVFGVEIEILQIESSPLAFNFKPVVVPNEWSKGTSVGMFSAKSQKYQKYFQSLLDEIREKHDMTNARKAYPQCWQSFPTGVSGFAINASFAQNNIAWVSLYIDRGDKDINKQLFDTLESCKDNIENECGCSLVFDRLDDKRACRIYIPRPGSIEAEQTELEEIRQWHIKHVLIFRKVFPPNIKQALAALKNGE